MIRALAMLLALGPMAAAAQQAVSQSGAELRVLDKVTGRVDDVTLPVGGAATSGLVTMMLNDCRVPADNTGKHQRTPKGPRSLSGRSTGLTPRFFAKNRKRPHFRENAAP